MFRTTIALRWSSPDAQGHVDNAVTADYLQEARIAFFGAGLCSELLDSGVAVVGHRISYLAPITYLDAGIGAEVAITRLGGARFNVVYALFQDATPVARTRAVLCPFDFKAQQLARFALTDGGWLTEHRAEVEPMRHIGVPDLGQNGSVTPCPVCWSDLDSYGHVNNIKVLDYLIRARITATTSWSPAMMRPGTRKAPLNWLIVRQDVNYINRIIHRMDPYAMRTASAALGHTSVTLAAEIFNPDDDTTFARGRTILVAANGEGKPIALLEEVRKGLTKRLIDWYRPCGLSRAGTTPGGLTGWPAHSSWTRAMKGIKAGASASRVAARGDVRGHTSAMSRLSVGGAIQHNTKPGAGGTGGRTVMAGSGLRPLPETIMWRMVSRLVAR